MPRTKEQFENIRAERKQQIIDVALEVFAQKGYHQSSISQIAQKANISKGLMYNYFNDKEDLLSEVMENGILYLLGGLSKVEGNNASEKLINLIRNSFLLMDEDRNYWLLYFSMVLQTDIQNLIKTKMMELAMPFFNRLSKIFSELGYEEPMLEAQFFGSMLDGIGVDYLLNPKEFPKEYCINRICKIYNLKETN